MGTTNAFGYPTIREESDAETAAKRISGFVVPDGLLELTGTGEARLALGSGTPWTEIAASASPDLSTAISDIGATPATLVIDDAFTLSTAEVIPSTLFLRFAKGAMITKSGSGSIEFEGYGLADPTSPVPIFSGFAAGDIFWSGTEYPHEITTELWDTGNASLTDRYNRADAAILGKQGKIVAYPRTITSTATLTSYHDLYLTKGDYDNTINTWGTTYFPAFLMKDNTTISGPPDKSAKIIESSVPGNCSMIQAWHARHGGGEAYTVQQENLFVHHLTFIGHEDQLDLSAGAGMILLGNTTNCAIEYCRFEYTHGYTAVLGLYGTNGNYAFNGRIEHNEFIGIGTQIAVLLNGKKISISWNYFDQRNSNGVSTYSPIDVEPNIDEDVVEYLTVEGNEMDCRDIADGSKVIFNAMAIQAALEGSMRHIIVRDNTIYSQDTFPLPTVSLPMTIGISVYGARDVLVTGNKVRTAYHKAYSFSRIRHLECHNNYGLQGASSFGDGMTMEVVAVSKGNISKNIFEKSSVTWLQATGIIEQETTHAVTASGSTITNLVSVLFNRFYDTYIDLPITLNATDYIVSVFGGHSSLTTSTSIGTLAQKTFVDANVNTGTDTINITGHGHNTGSYIWLTTTGTVPAGLTANRGYFAIRVDADNLKLANTLALALAGTPVNITAASGEGTHTITPLLVTKHSDNRYWGNKTEDGLLLEPTGTSRELPLSIGEMPAFSGAITTEEGSTVATIPDGSIGPAKLTGGEYPTVLAITGPFVVDPVPLQTVVGVTISGADNKQTKTAADGWGTGGVFSETSFSGDCELEWTVTEITTYRTVGFAYTPVDYTQGAINYGWAINNVGGLDTIEGGTPQQSAGTAVANTTVLTIRRVGTTITYYKDGGLQDTSSVASSGPLFIGTAIYDNGATVGGLKFTNLEAGAVEATPDPVVNTITVNSQLTTPKIVWTGDVKDLRGTGSPEGAVVAAVGSTYRRTDGGNNTSLYVKESGSGNTGWVAIGGFAAPGPIGSGTPNTIAGTTLNLGGATVSDFLSNTASLDFDLTSVEFEDLTITVAGAVVGDTVMLGIPDGSTSDVIYSGWVSAADTVKIRATRIEGTTPNPASGTFRATVIKI